jgi:cytochrome oxidase Cu insertion factor (SCO1/SenC/PrrC family)
MKRFLPGLLALVLVSTIAYLRIRSRADLGGNVAGPSNAVLFSGAQASPDNNFGSVADFALTDQSGKTVTNADLKGKIWVASFLFTRCATLCPQVASTMAQVQSDPAVNNNVALISVSVDPEFDTPAVLKAYAARYGADAERWRFLTGPKDKVYALIQSSFHLGVAENSGAERTAGNEVTHSGKLAVVDRRGMIRAYFDGRRVDEQGQPVNEIPKLQQFLNELMREEP